MKNLEMHVTVNNTEIKYYTDNLHYDDYYFIQKNNELKKVNEYCNSLQSQLFQFVCDYELPEIEIVFISKDLRNAMKENFIEYYPDIKDDFTPEKLLFLIETLGIL